MLTRKLTQIFYLAYTISRNQYMKTNAIAKQKEPNKTP